VLFIGLIARLFGRCSFFDLLEQTLPTLRGLQPKCSILGIDRVPCQFSAFFDLPLEKEFFVEHGGVRRGRLPPKTASQIWGLHVPSAHLKTLERDHQILIADCVQARANQCPLIERFGVLQVGNAPPAGRSCRHFADSDSADLVKCWRPRPELNRGKRFCRPLRNHSATWPCRHG
jgi:hypothetical protein